MKRGCFVIALVIPLILFALVGVAAYRANSALGLMQAAEVSHETLATPDTRVRAVVKLDKLTGFITEHMPPRIDALPTWVPVTPKQVVPEVLPHEIALLAGSDYGAREIKVTLFINEKRGGPAMVDTLNEQHVLQNIKEVHWQPTPFSLKQRGVMTAVGTIPIPDGLEARILETWSHAPKGEPLKVSGDHAIEIAVDNRNGELETLIGSLAEAYGKPWDALFKDQYVGQALLLLPHVIGARLDADLAGKDLIAINSRIEADPTASAMLEMPANAFIVPMLKTELLKRGLTLEGEAHWDAKQNALVGKFTLAGWEKYLQQMMPRAKA